MQWVIITLRYVEVKEKYKHEKYQITKEYSGIIMNKYWYLSVVVFWLKSNVKNVWISKRL